MPTSHTLASTFTVEGVGLHSGLASRVTVRPCSQGGRVFHCAGTKVPALVDYVSDTRRSTTLERDGVSVRTVEHLLAALWLAGIDHADIEVDGPELPALDGSARPWHAAILAAGVRPLTEEAPVYRVPGPQWIEEGASQFLLCPGAEPALYAALDIPDTVAVRMMAGGLLTDAEVCAQIVRARTFALEVEVQALRDAGLARGGSLENAVVLTRDGFLNDHVWPAEPAWHKVLDFAGDLALTGVRVCGTLLAMRGGHRSHVALARMLRAAWQASCPETAGAET